METNGAGGHHAPLLDAEVGTGAAAAAGEVEWLGALPDEADDDPASWACLVFLPRCHFSRTPWPVGGDVGGG